jgi:hypothetical protein
MTLEQLIKESRKKILSEKDSKIRGSYGTTGAKKLLLIKRFFDKNPVHNPKILDIGGSDFTYKAICEIFPGSKITTLNIQKYHVRNCPKTVLQNAEKIELKEKFDNNKCNFEKFLKDFCPEETKIVIESSSIWEYIYEMLEEMKYEVKLANPTKTRAIAEARIKTDHVDADTLCDLLRANLVAESYIPTKEIRNLRNIMRQRKAIVKGRTQMKNKIHAVLLMNGIKLPYAELSPTAMQWIIDEINARCRCNARRNGN